MIRCAGAGLGRSIVRRRCGSLRCAILISRWGPRGRVSLWRMYRGKHQWEGGINTSVLVVRELITLTTEASAALWQFFFGVDLMHTVQAVNRPVDESLRWMLTDSRRLRVNRITDDLWVRLLDIPVALAARRYATTERVVFEVSDAFRPEQAGRYLLVGGPEGAECRATDAAADLTLDVVELGAVYLGGVRFS